MFANDETHDLLHLQRLRIEATRWRAERERASANLKLAQVEEAGYRLLALAEPVGNLPIDRDILRILLRYLAHGDDKRLLRELTEDGHLPEEALT